MNEHVVIGVMNKVDVDKIATAIEDCDSDFKIERSTLKIKDQEVIARVLDLQGNFVENLSGFYIDDVILY